MSIDYYNCGSCDEIHSDCEPMHSCSNCEAKIFDCCYEKQVEKYGIIGPNDVNEDGMNLVNYFGSGALKKCDSCQKEEITISKEEYEDLQKDSEKLARLIAAGVDNWIGYDEA